MLMMMQLLLLLVSDNDKSTCNVVLYVFSVRNMWQFRPYDNYVASDADDDAVAFAVGLRKR
jgi:hypothetical protein